MRAPFQVVIFAFRATSGPVEYAVLRRSDAGYWQAIAGGGEDGESVLDAARREAEEEASLPRTSRFFRLDTINSVPIYHFAPRKEWPENLYVITNYAFGVDATNSEIVLSHEHTQVIWMPFHEAYSMLHWEGNKIALWELNQRILQQDLHEAED